MQTMHTQSTPVHLEKNYAMSLDACEDLNNSTQCCLIKQYDSSKLGQSNNQCTQDSTYMTRGGAQKQRQQQQLSPNTSVGAPV